MSKQTTKPKPESVSETFVLYPERAEDRAFIKATVAEVLKTLLSRADGVAFKVERSNSFPPMNGKPLIVGFTVKTWDIAA